VRGDNEEALLYLRTVVQIEAIAPQTPTTRLLLFMNMVQIWTPARSDPTTTRNAPPMRVQTTTPIPPRTAKERDGKIEGQGRPDIDSEAC